MSEKIGLIAGNGSFPLLVLDAARARGLNVVVAAIREEAFPEIEQHGAASVYWLSLGELSKLIEILKREGVSRAVMAGQVRHKQIFSTIRPDWRLAKLLLSLSTRNTDSLIGAVAKVLADEGITLMSSTELLEPLLARAGVLTHRAPTEQERIDIDYGRRVGRHLAQFDIGQTVVIAGAACVSVEAMEGTDAAIERAARIMTSLHDPFLADHSKECHPDPERAQRAEGEGPVEEGGNTLSRNLTVVKVAKPAQDMRFDVPVVGVRTIETMRAAGATCLALDAGKCLLLDGGRVIQAADAAGICIVAD